MTLPSDYPFLNELRPRLKAMPDLPGVYLMRDENSEVIYVGKARQLKSRVSSYFNKGDGRSQIEYLLERIRDIEIIVTEDERQALVLEIDLIKKFKPYYNVRLKDDKAPLMVRIDRSLEWPRIELVRKRFDDGALYFGPYPFRYELTALLDAIERAIPLRTCTDRVMMNRVRPCLQHQIGRCLAPCCHEVETEDYTALLEQAISILSGNTDNVIHDLERRMNIASEQLRFEDAATLRDRLQILERVKSDRSSVFYGEGNIDAFAFYREGRSMEVSVLRTIYGKLSSGETFGFSDIALPNEEILSAVISQFYSTVRSIPQDIILSIELEDKGLYEDSLSDRLGKKVHIQVPQRGIKARLIELAQVNAKENFEARFSSQKKNERILSALRDTLSLEQIPRVMECIDISHIQGSSTVGAVVSFKDGVPDKSRYRYFHLSQEGKPDDFASMNETVRRHLSRGAEENTLCDLLVIDGGPPQIIQALKVRKELGLNYPVIIALAKKRETYSPNIPRSASKNKSNKYSLKPERIYIEDNPVPLILPVNSEILHLLERLRNETHRSAIGFHRKVRSKKQFVGPLDSIPGLGPERKKLLLRTFGSIAGIRNATKEDLMNKAKIPSKLALLIVQKLSEVEK